MFIRILLLLSTVFSLAACQSTSNQTASAALTQFPVIPPKQIPLKYEQELAQLNVLLAGFDSEEDKQAYFLYRRAVRYDQIGLHRLAERDFATVIKLVPQFADAYLHLGIYALSRLDFESAYQHFDSVIELAPDNNWVYLNRGIALYYGARYDLALQDFDYFEKAEPSELYVILWKFLAMQQQDPKQANQYLNEALKSFDKGVWVAKLANALVGKISATELLNEISVHTQDKDGFADLLCEAYFYLGKRMQQIGEQESARIFFTLATTPNVTEMVEHRLALLELRLMQLNDYSE